ncbi:hypothetical protein [Desulfatiferula olefinivorans]
MDRIGTRIDPDADGAGIQGQARQVVDHGGHGEIGGQALVVDQQTALTACDGHIGVGFRAQAHGDVRQRHAQGRSVIGGAEDTVRATGPGLDDRHVAGQGLTGNIKGNARPHQPESGLDATLDGAGGVDLNQEGTAHHHIGNGHADGGGAGPDHALIGQGEGAFAFGDLDEIRGAVTQADGHGAHGHGHAAAALFKGHVARKGLAENGQGDALPRHLQVRTGHKGQGPGDSACGKGFIDRRRGGVDGKGEGPGQADAGNVQRRCD